MKTKSPLLFGLAVLSLCSFADDPITKVFDLPYVESQGVTQASQVDNWGSVLQTDCQLTSKSVVEIELELFSIEKDGAIFCNRVSSSSKSTYSLFYVLNKGWRFDYNSTTAEYGGMPEADRRYKLKLSPEGLWVDGVKTIEKTPKDFDLPTKICFFATYTYTPATDDAPESYSSYSSWSNGKAKIYSFKVYEPDADGELQLAYELQPCYASNGKVCLADSAKGIAYTTSRPSYPLASTFTAKAKDGAAGIVTTFGYARSAALNGTSLAGSKFHVAIEPGVYDLKDVSMSDTSHLVANFGKSGWIIGLGKSRGDVVLKGLGDADTRRILLANSYSVTNLTVTGGNLTAADDGGGICGSYDSSGTVVSCIVSNNYAKGSNGNGGGGLFRIKNVRDCLIVDNKSANGGGVRLCGNVCDCIISNNIGVASGGGASGGSLWRCQILNNTTEYNGGGTYGAVLTDCTLVGNRCHVGGNYGGGGGVNGGAATNCTFVGNGDYNANSAYGSVAAGSRIVSCTVTNSVARRSLFDGCTVERTYIARCGASANDGTYSFNVFGRSSGSSKWNVVNTIVEDIVRSNASDRVSRHHNLFNCTVRNVTGKTYGPIDETASAVNTIIADCTPYDVTASKNGALTNCLYKTSSGEFAEGRLVDCHQVSSVRWSKEGGPYLCDIRASSKAYNRGLETDDILALVGETDKAGRPRVMFGHLDIGALECQDDTLPGLLMTFR